MGSGSDSLKFKMKMANKQPNLYNLKEQLIHNEAEMGEIANVLWRNLRPIVGKRAIILGLEGPLGAGKTTFIKLFAKAAGVKEEMVSPTYVLHIPHNIQYSKFNIQLNHIDAWRMEEFGELEQVGLGKMIDDKSIIVIEWADKFREDIRILGYRDIKLIWVEIDYGDGEGERRIKINDL